MFGWKSGELASITFSGLITDSSRVHYFRTPLERLEKVAPYLYFETWGDDCYHEPCDDADRLDYDGMAAITRLAFDVLADLADTDIDLVAARASAGCPE